MKSLLAWGLGGCLSVLITASAQALAPAGITVESALNQPLRARIALLNASAAELSSLTVRATDASAGRDLAFHVETDSSGQAQLWVTTSQPVQEPALNLWLEFNWHGGRLLREYSILLNPQ